MLVAAKDAKVKFIYAASSSTYGDSVDKGRGCDRKALLTR
jgi:hypothetical protein